MSSRSSGAGRASKAAASPIVRAWRRLRRAAGESLLRNGVYIMSTTAVSALIGFGFWLVAARSFSAAEVGRAAVVVSAMQFVAVITNLGIGQVLVSRLSSRQPGREWSLTVTTGLLATTVASLLGGLLAATLAPSLHGGSRAAVFVLLPIGVAAMACSQVLDFACIAERQARPSLVRNTAAALLRLALIVPAAADSHHAAVWLPTTWVVSFLVIDVHGVFRVLPALNRGFHLTLGGLSEELGELRRLIAGHQAINLGSQAPAYLLPVIVSARLGATDGAYYYATFMLAYGLFFIAPAIGNSLFAESSKHPQRTRRDLKRAASYIALLATPLALLLLAAGPILLGIFGAAYADAGTALLYVLVLSTLFDAPYQLMLAVLRARGRLGGAAAATWTLLVTSVLTSWLLLPRIGIVGAGIGWAVGKACGLGVGAIAITRSRSQEPAHLARHH